jgi:hypothetical protein
LKRSILTKELVTKVMLPDEISEKLLVHTGSIDDLPSVKT